MRVPLGWLRDYVDIPIPVGELIERLTLAGLEVSSVYVYGLPVPAGVRVKSEDAGPVWTPDKIVIGKVLQVQRHPNADRLTLATVDYGAAEPKTVVTGAPNIRVGDTGQTVVVALSGSVLFDGHSEQKTLRELKPSKIRGVPSDAMVCSAYELGISDEHEGIILLDEPLAPGTPAAEVFGEIVIEVDVLPNMARCLSMIGMAREVAALTGRALQLPRAAPAGKGPQAAGRVEVAIEDPKLCARYAAGLCEAVHIGPSPGAMQRRLNYAGMRPISNIVDIANYVMLEWGQPLHTFDYDRLQERAAGRTPAITVRPARAGEKLKTLDGVERPLKPEHLIIADSAGPVAIAGVMGGAETEVTPSTSNILLESANFDFLSIRRTMKELNLPSEASVRFSKGIHPEIVAPAAGRAQALMELHAAGLSSPDLVDVYPAPPPAQKIELSLDRVKRLLGMDVSANQAATILKSLEFKVEPGSPGVLQVTAPPHRLDIQSGTEDLIEELGRIIGYDRLPATLLADSLPEQREDHDLAIEERVRDTLVSMGLQEIMTYALTEPGAEAPLGSDSRPYVEIVNPISSDMRVMRHSVLASMLRVAAVNLRQADTLELFEIGTTYEPVAGEKLPLEQKRLGLVLTGRRQDEFWADSQDRHIPTYDFFDAKGVLASLWQALHLDAVVTYEPAQASWLHPARSAHVKCYGELIGTFGELHPKATAAYDLAERAVLAGEFNLQRIFALVPDRFDFRPVPRFPPALRDIAVIVAEDVPAARVEQEIRTAGAPLLADLRLFDLYRGESIPAGTKSLAYALTYQAADRTLVDKEVDKAHKKIEDRLKHVLKARIRGQENGQ
jgi:phenylalanyl-tRNA synthetase beta chain